jgi:large subunit ribosomal protein L29
MPQTKAKDLRELPDEDLLERVESLKEELFNLRFQFATGQLDNPMRIRTVRHDIARLLTVLRQRGTGHELEEALARADEQALAESREAQARGEKKGTSLADAAHEARVEAEAASGAEYLPDEEEPGARGARE